MLEYRLPVKDGAILVKLTERQEKRNKKYKI
jgi:hypothetical protein